ncbi:unnamed protein product, partial [Didymodactylos carnosus]
MDPNPFKVHSHALSLAWPYLTRRGYVRRDVALRLSMAWPLQVYELNHLQRGHTVVATPTEKKPLIIAHRGASGYLPEHTLPSKAMGNHVYSLSSLSFVDIVVLFLAFGYDVDYIEQDVALTKDDVPLVIHDIYLDEVTDVKQIYPDRHRPNG